MMKKRMVQVVLMLVVVILAGRAVLKVAGLGAQGPGVPQEETLTLAPEVEEGLERLEERGKLSAEEGQAEPGAGAGENGSFSLPIPPTDLVMENGEVRILYINPAQVCRPGDEMLDLYRNICYSVTEISENEQSIDPADVYLEPELLDGSVFSADGTLNPSFIKEYTWLEEEWITIDGREVPTLKEAAREEKEGTRKLRTVTLRAENLQDSEQTIDMLAFQLWKTSLQEGYLAYISEEESAPEISAGDASSYYLYSRVWVTCQEQTGNAQRIDSNKFVLPGKSEAEFVLAFLVDCEEEEDLYLQFNPLGKGSYEYDSSQFFFVKLK